MKRWRTEEDSPDEVIRLVFLAEFRKSHLVVDNGGRDEGGDDGSVDLRQRSVQVSTSKPSRCRRTYHRRGAWLAPEQ